MTNLTGWFGPRRRRSTRLRQMPLWCCSCVQLLVLGGFQAAWAQYHTYTQIGSELAATEAAYPTLCKVYNLGQTVQNRPMWAIRISDNVDVDEDEPEVRYISTIHGDEIVGVEMCMNLIDYLVTGYESDPRVTNIVDSIELWIVPCMNPDGFVAGQRYNQNGIDLNRSFPDPFTSPENSAAGREPETGNIINWTAGRSFTLGANLHGGTLVVNYPFDNNASGSSVYTASPDDDLFIEISEQYSVHNAPMWSSSSFYHGITNGAAWYAISGGLQDWGYRYMGSNEVTIELSTIKSPSYSQIPTYWSQNQESMLAYIETALWGVRGMVTDARAGTAVDATVTVTGRAHTVYTDPDVGDYHRMLLPGTYELLFESADHDPLRVSGVSVSPGAATRLDVSLWRTLILSPAGGETLAVNHLTEVAWSGDPSKRFQVQYTANADDTDAWVDGFESGVLDAAYSTGGHQRWAINTANTFEGSFSVKSGSIGNSQVSWLARSVAGAQLRFRYLVSSEAGGDFFNFYVGADRKIHTSGTGAGWQEYVVALPAGAQTLTWEYEKDGSATGGSDAVWIDGLEVTTDNTIWTDVVALTDVGASSVPWLPTVESTTCKVRVRSYAGSGQYGAWDESDATFAVGPETPVPTVSEWGLIAMTLLLLISAAIILQGRRGSPAVAHAWRHVALVARESHDE